MANLLFFCDITNRKSEEHIDNSLIRRTCPCGIGCFVIGLCYGLFNRYAARSLFRLLLTIGFCGGFTTFSTFINENYQLLQSSNALLMLAYVAASVIVGLILLYAGYAASQF